MVRTMVRAPLIPVKTYLGCRACSTNVNPKATDPVFGLPPGNLDVTASLLLSTFRFARERVTGAGSRLSSGLRLACPRPTARAGAKECLEERLELCRGNPSVLLPVQDAPLVRAQEARQGGL